MEFKLPSFETIVEIHSVVIDLYGGFDGFPHPKTIEGALARPKHYMSYEKECDIHLVAALILDSIARNHAFSDGNKRTALITMLMTYRLNGITLEYNLHMNEKFEELVLRVAQKKPSIKETREKLQKLVEEFTQ